MAEVGGDGGGAGGSVRREMDGAYRRKIVTFDELVSRVKALRRQGRTIAHCHGCFDIVHPGHLRYLEFARRQADVLLVSLTSDAAIDKGVGRPYIPEALRAENLAALEPVDLVYIDHNETAVRLIEAVRPDVYVKGREYENSQDPRFLAERSAVERCGGRVVFSSGEVVFSSSRLIASMPEDAALEGERLAGVCRRYGITAERLGEIVSRFAGRRVVVVGDVVVDHYVECDALNVANEAPVMSLRQLGSRRYAGGAAMIARHLRALGAWPLLISSRGQDERSRWLVDALDLEGIEHYLFRFRESVVEKTRFLVEGTKLLKVEQGGTCTPDSVVQRQIAEVVVSRSRGADALVLADFGYGLLGGGWVDRVLPALRRTVPVIAGDVSNGKGNLLRFVEADFLTPTERELRDAVHDYDSGLSSVAWEVMQRTRARHLLVTLGKGGVVVFDRPTQDPRSPGWSGRLRSEHLPSLAGAVVDRLGCGDALLAVAVLARASGASLMQAAYLGSVGAAIEVACVGNVPVEQGMLRSWLERRPELHVAESEPAVAGSEVALS